MVFRVVKALSFEPGDGLLFGLLYRVGKDVDIDEVSEQGVLNIEVFSIVREVAKELLFFLLKTLRTGWRRGGVKQGKVGKFNLSTSMKGEGEIFDGLTGDGNGILGVWLIKVVWLKDSLSLVSTKRYLAGDRWLESNEQGGLDPRINRAVESDG